MRQLISEVGRVGFWVVCVLGVIAIGVEWMSPGLAATTIDPIWLIVCGFVCLGFRVNE